MILDGDLPQQEYRLLYFVRDIYQAVEEAPTIFKSKCASHEKSLVEPYQDYWKHDSKADGADRDDYAATTLWIIEIWDYSWWGRHGRRMC